MKRYTYILIIALMGLALIASCGKRRDAQKIRNLEEKFENEQDVQEKSMAANDLHRAYSLYYLQNPHDTIFLRNWARMAMEGMEYDQARDIFTRLIQNDADDPEIFASRGRVNARLGYFSQASDDFLAASELTRNDRLCFQYVSLSNFYSGTDSVLNATNVLINEGKDIIKYRLERAAQLMECKHYSAADADVKIVLEMDSADVHALLLLSEIGLRSGDYENSRKAIARFFEIHKYNDTLTDKALYISKEIDHQRQLLQLEKQIREDPSDYEVLIDATALAFELSEYDRAMFYIRNIIEFYPDSIYGYLYRGQVLIQKGDPGKSVSDFDRVLSLQPENISARNLKAYAYLLMGKKDLLMVEIEKIKSMGGEPLEILKPYSKE
ncbi:MAG: hypothetical protein K9J30_11330 [Bacteroidales bacterium]|nr:hypothetical protein [Bacteroidales bacterium]